MYTQQQANRNHMLNNIANPPGSFGIVQTVSKPCVNERFTFIRILNAMMEPINITVYINDIEVCKDLKYKEVSYYLPVLKGNNNIKIYSTKQRNNPIIEFNTLNIPTNQAVTIPIWKSNDLLNATVVIDDVTQDIYPDKVVSRIVNLTPDRLLINVSSEESKYNTDINLKPGEYYGYSVKNLGRYIYEFTLPTNPDLRPIRLSLDLMPSRIYTNYIVGIIDLYTEEYQKGYNLELIVSTDGNTIIRRCP